MKFYSKIFLLFFCLSSAFAMGCASPHSTYVRMNVWKGDIEFKEKTPLMYAAQVGDLKKVEEFISKGAEINVKNEAMDLMTPLHYAVAKGHIDIARVLIENGANVNALTDILWTPLHYAAFNGNAELVSLLIKNGSDLNSKDGESLTPLHYAVMNGHSRIAGQLINAGAIPITCNDDENAEYSELSAACLKMMAENYAQNHKSRRKVNELYRLAGNCFESASTKYKKKAQEAFSKEMILIGAVVLANAASIAAASYQANAQAKQMARLSAMKSSDGVGKGYGVAAYYWIYPSSYPKTSSKYNELSESCHQYSLECFRNAEEYK